MHLPAIKSNNLCIICGSKKLDSFNTTDKLCDICDVLTNAHKNISDNHRDMKGLMEGLSNKQIVKLMRYVGCLNDRSKPIGTRMLIDCLVYESQRRINMLSEMIPKDKRL